MLRDHPATLHEFRGLFSESADPRQWPHVATAAAYRDGIVQLSGLLGCEPAEEAVLERRRSTAPAAYAGALLRATGTERLYLDDGFPPRSVAFSPDEMASLSGARTAEVLRIERVAEEALARRASLPELRELVRTAVATAGDRGHVALKTIAAYRSGLRLPEPDPAAVPPAALSGGRLADPRLVSLLLHDALEANAAGPLPLQVHAGFGDADVRLPAADPGHLQPLIERFPATPFVLLHCYPFVRQAGWLAHVYANVWLDVSLTIPHVARPAESLREALELAPYSKLLYASDAARAPELYYLAARRWRGALAAVLPELFDDPEPAARAILRENALALYG